MKTIFLYLSQDGFVFDIQFLASGIDDAMQSVREIYGDVTLIQWGVR